MYDNPKLDEVASSLYVKLCTGSEKLFCACSPWELLNLDPPTVAGIPEQLSRQFNISTETLSDILKPYTFDTIGREELDKAFGITRPVKYIALDDHFKWTRGCALTGIGSANLINIATGNSSELEAHIVGCFAVRFTRGKNSNTVSRTLY